MTLQQFSLIWDGRYDSLEPGQRLRIDERSTASFRGLRWSSSGSLSRGIYVCVSSFPVGFSEESCPSEWSRERSAPSSVARVCRLTPLCTRTTLCLLSLLHHRRRWVGAVGFPIVLGGISYRIRILMYRDVSCMYPVGYTYLECILMYLKCILNALLHSKRIHVS